MLEKLHPPPNVQDSQFAREATAKLVPFVQAQKPLKLQIVEAEDQEPLVLPVGALALLKHVLEAMAAGHRASL